MYLAHYGLDAPPFSITPDPRFVFLGERHRDALAHLTFGIDKGGGGGFVQLTGEVGTGKTTLSRLLLEQLPADTRVALVLNPRQGPVELLETICEELHLDIAGRRGSSKALVDALNAYLLRAYADGQRVVLIIDEAQDLSVDALEQVRLLTNLETDTQKLLQVVLLGQPELRDLLARPDLRQLAQRITARFHLTPLDADETGAYMRHRFRVAGGQRFPFDARAVRCVHARAGGVPRLVNVIAERALLAGYARDLATIDARTVDRAADEALGGPRDVRPPWRLRSALALAGVALVAASLVLALSRTRGNDATAAPGAVDVPGAAATAPATAAVAPPPAIAAWTVADFEEVLAGVPAPELAWRALLARWDADDARAPLPPGRACIPVLAPGLYCVQGRASAERIATLGRPALLAMDDTADRWVLLTGLDATRARVRLGDAEGEVERSVLERAGALRFVTAWRGPQALAPWADGSATAPTGPARDWILARLGMPGRALSDAGLRQAILRFQQARGLAADGIAGPETLMALGVAEDGPRLARELGDPR
ncbi:ExeA family protein [Luteimonas pelagia]